MGTHFIYIEKSAEHPKYFRGQYNAFPFLYKSIIKFLYIFVKILTNMYNNNLGISKAIHT